MDSEKYSSNCKSSTGCKIIILNVANSISLEEEDRELFKKADVVFDTSGRNLSNLGELLKIYGKDKFAFGTHSPILDYITGHVTN